MRYKVNRLALFSVAGNHILFFLLSYLIISINKPVELIGISKVHYLLMLYLTYCPSLLVQATALIIAGQTRKINKWAFWCSIVALVLCTAFLISTIWTHHWLSCGTYLGLGFILLSISFSPDHNTTEENNAKKPSKRLSMLIAGMLAVVMLIIAVVSFVEGNPAFSISNQIIYIFVLVIVLLVWDSIEALSLGSIVTLSKDVKDKDKKVQNLTEENRELRNQIISIVQNHQSTNLNLSIVGNEAKVAPAIKDDSAHQETDYENVDTATVVETEERSRIPYGRSITSQIENIAFCKFVRKNGFNHNDLQKEVEFSEKFISGDQLMVRNVVFDAYMKRRFDEIFIETALDLARTHAHMHIYYLLSKISQYRQVNKCDAKLILVVPIIDREALQVTGVRYPLTFDCSRFLPRFKEIFAPAISNDLLEVAEIEITNQDIESLVQKDD